MLFEFWQGRPSRLHDRFRYRWQDGDWDQGARRSMTQSPLLLARKQTDSDRTETSAVAGRRGLEGAAENCERALDGTAAACRSDLPIATDVSSHLMWVQTKMHSDDLPERGCVVSSKKALRVTGVDNEV